MRQRALGLLLLVCGPERRAVQVRAEEVHVAVGELVGPAARIAGGVDRRPGVAVVAAVEADRTLCRPVCSRAMRIAFSMASAPPLVKKTFECPGGARSMIAFAVRPRTNDACCGARVAWTAACLDRLDHLRVLVADVGVHQLAGEVEELVALEVPHLGARPGGEHLRLERALRAPRVEHVGTVEVVRLRIAALGPRIAAEIVACSRHEPNVSAILESAGAPGPHTAGGLGWGRSRSSSRLPTSRPGGRHGPGASHGIAPPPLSLLGPCPTKSDPWVRLPPPQPTAPQRARVRRLRTEQHLSEAR